MKKILLCLLAAILGLPILLYTAYDLSQFQVRRGEIDDVLERAAIQDRHPPEQVRRMLEVSETNGPSGYAARLLARELNAFSGRGSMLGWHANSALWWSLVKLHLTAEEQTTIFLSLAPTGIDRRGFTSTALALYQRQPSDLTLPEVATILALIRAPTASEELKGRMRDRFLVRYEAGSNKTMEPTR